VLGHPTHRAPLRHFAPVAPHESTEQGPLYPCGVGSGSAVARPMMIDVMKSVKRILMNCSLFEDERCFNRNCKRMRRDLGIVERGRGRK
jgi:hypothetical protein